MREATEGLSVICGETQKALHEYKFAALHCLYCLSEFQMINLSFSYRGVCDWWMSEGKVWYVVTGWKVEVQGVTFLSSVSACCNGVWRRHKLLNPSSKLLWRCIDQLVSIYSLFLKLLLLCKHLKNHNLLVQLCSLFCNYYYIHD